MRIFIYDDHNDRIQSLSMLLEMAGEHEVVGTATNTQHVLEDMKNTNPEIVLMDLNMPDFDGLSGLKHIKSTFPNIQVLIQTAYDQDDKIFSSIKNGASGYILKSDKPQKILQAIEEVFDGGAAMNPIIAKKVMNYFLPKGNDNTLTAKELEVLGLLSEGLSYKMVADKLGISYTTVNTHTKRIYEKLHISSLGEAIAYYYKNLH